MIFPSRQGGHDNQTQLLNQVLHHLADMSELLVARQLNRPLDYGWLTRLPISYLTMKIGGQFQHSIAGGVRVVHIEQGHLPVGWHRQGNFQLLPEGGTHRCHARLKRVDTSINTVQIHDKIFVTFPRFTYTASSLGRESRSNSPVPCLANSPTLVVGVQALCI